MICGTGSCQVDIIQHDPSAGLRMLVSLYVQLHVEEGREFPPKIP